MSFSPAFRTGEEEIAEARAPGNVQSLCPVGSHLRCNQANAKFMVRTVDLTKTVEVGQMLKWATPWLTHGKKHRILNCHWTLYDLYLAMLLG